MRQAYLVRSLSVVIAVLIVQVRTAGAVSYLVSGPWANAATFGDGPITDGNTNHPIVGDVVDDPNTASNAAGQEMLSSPFTSITLAQADDTITLSGTATIQGAVVAADGTGAPRTQFRIGLFNHNTSTDAIGWSGYIMQNASGTGTPNGGLTRRAAPNTTAYLSTAAGSGTSTLQATSGTQTIFNDDTFTLNISIKREADSSVTVTGTLTGTATTNYLMSITKNEPAATVTTYTFDRLGFLTGNNLAADRVAYADLVATATGPSFNAGLFGDFNSDNVVDAGDYVTWAKNNGTNNALANDNGLGTPIGPAHYDLWRANFGNPPGSGSSLVGAAVPEPATLLIVSMAAAVLLVAARRRVKLAPAIVRK